MMQDAAKQRQQLLGCLLWTKTQHSTSGTLYHTPCPSFPLTLPALPSLTPSLPFLPSHPTCPSFPHTLPALPSLTPSLPFRPSHPSCPSCYRHFASSSYFNLLIAHCECLNSSRIPPAFLLLLSWSTVHLVVVAVTPPPSFLLFAPLIIQLIISILYHHCIRWVDLRTPANQSIFRIQSGVCQLFREFLSSKGFIEVICYEI